MNNKGQVAIAAAVLIVILVATVSLPILDGIISPMYTATTVTNESLGTVTGGTTDELANSCLISAPTSVYDWTNATDVLATNYTLSPGTYPNTGANTITWDSGADFVANNTVVTIDYTYGCSYQPNSILKTILPYVAVFFAIGIIVLIAAGFVL